MSDKPSPISRAASRMNANSPLRKQGVSSGAQIPNIPGLPGVLPGGLPGAFTLVEMVVALAITSLLLLAVASTVLLASQAVPHAAGRFIQTVAAGNVLEQLTTELQQAQRICDRGTHAVTFTVADRNGDGVPERIRYAWAGTSGDALTRQYNGAAESTVIQHVTQFDLSYVQSTSDETLPGPPILAGTQPMVVAQHVSSGDDGGDDGGGGLLGGLLGGLGGLLGGGGSLPSFSITSWRWAGQYVTPTLPADAVRWQPVRADVVAECRYSSLLGIRFRAWTADTTVQVRSVKSNGLPSDSTFAQGTMPSAALGTSFGAASISLAPVSGAMGTCRPGEPVALVLGSTGGNAAILAYDNDADSGEMLESSNGGGSWDSDDDDALYYDLYGYVWTPGPTQTVTHAYLKRVEIQLTPQADDAVTLGASVSLLNRPAVLSGRWSMDGSYDPTAADVDGDGTKDWRSYYGGSFTPSSDGIWHASQILLTQPAFSSTQPVVLETSLRYAASDSGYAFAMLMPRSSGGSGAVYAMVSRASDGTQTLVFYIWGGGSWSVAMTLTELPQDWIRLRMLANPATSSVNVNINGVDRGTYSYPIVSGMYAGAEVGGSGSGAEFDDVSVELQ